MQSYQYIPLSSWLGNADVLYLDARVLWLHISGMGGGLILMWLACEQLMKTIVFQGRIEKGELKATNSQEVQRQLNSWGMNLGHSFSNNLSALYELHPNLFSKDEEGALENVYNHFEARYVTNKSMSIEVKELNVLDGAYFKLRDLISKDLPMSHMDMIDEHRQSSHYGMADYTRYAFLDNPHFHKRSEYRV